MTPEELYWQMVHSVAPVVKDQANPHFNSKYAGLVQVAAAGREAAMQHGFGLREGLEYVDGLGWVATLKLTHLETDHQMAWKVPVLVERPGPQPFRSALTYARRTVYEVAFQMTPHDDDGNLAHRDKPEAPRRPERPPEARPAPEAGPAAQPDPAKVKAAVWTLIEKLNAKPDTAAVIAMVQANEKLLTVAGRLDPELRGMVFLAAEKRVRSFLGSAPGPAEDGLERLAIIAADAPAAPAGGTYR